MNNDKRVKFKDGNKNNLDDNIDMFIPIDEIEIDGVSMKLSKLDDYSKRIYSTYDNNLECKNEISVDEFNILSSDIDANNKSNGFDILSSSNSISSVKKYELAHSKVIDDKEDNTEFKKSQATNHIEKEDLARSKGNLKKQKNNKVKPKKAKKELTHENNKKKIIKKKKAKKNSVMIITMAGCSALIGVKGYQLYEDYQAEQLRLSELDKEKLDLKLIVNSVDNYGGDSYQLNWKEIASIMSVITKNNPEKIDESLIKDVSLRFIDNENKKVKKLEEAIEDFNFSKKEIERVYNYYEDLKNYGYKPERLEEDSPQMIFINSIMDGAKKSYRETGILPSIIIAQAILESNWGNSNLTIESNNLFGIKADPSWKGEYVTFETKEYHNQMIKDKFRKYNTRDESIVDHGKFLMENKRYVDGGVFEAKTYKAQALALQESGYSTAQDEHGNKIYASKLGELIRQYNLQIIDCEILRNQNI